MNFALVCRKGVLLFIINYSLILSDKLMKKTRGSRQVTTWSTQNFSMTCIHLTSPLSPFLIQPQSGARPIYTTVLRVAFPISQGCSENTNQVSRQRAYCRKEKTIQANHYVFKKCHNATCTLDLLLAPP